MESKDKTVLQRSEHNEKNSAPDSTHTVRASWNLPTIMAEFTDATERLSGLQSAVAIFGSARTKIENPHYQLSVDIARRLSDAGFAVLSGGGPGIMEAANKGALAGKSPSIGLNIELPHEQSNNQWQNISIRFQHFFTRKAAFVKYADAYVVLPGGYGTLDELCEVLTLIQTGKSHKVPVILVGTAFWSGLLDWFRTQLVGQGMIHADDMNLLQIIDEPEQIIATILTFCQADAKSSSATTYSDAL